MNLVIFAADWLFSSHQLLVHKETFEYFETMCVKANQSHWIE